MTALLDGTSRPMRVAAAVASNITVDGSQPDRIATAIYCPRLNSV
jgi:hypothetical protein